jgi:hypothetical protein
LTLPTGTDYFLSEVSLKAYRRDVRLSVLMSRGIVNPAIVATDTELDRAIVSLAARVLPKTQKLVFSVAYYCQPTWSAIVQELEKAYGKTYGDLETVRTTANRALERLTSEAKDAPELAEWQRTFSGSRKKV